MWKPVEGLAERPRDPLERILGPPESEGVNTTEKAQVLLAEQTGEHSMTPPSLAWQTARAKVPSYNWTEVKGDFKLKLKDDELSKQLRAGQERYTFTAEGKTKQRINLNFPLVLWSKVGWW